MNAIPPCLFRPFSKTGAMLAMAALLAGAMPRAAAANETPDAGSGLPPMLNLAGTGEDPAAIVFADLPLLKGTRGIITFPASPWLFRLHSYLAYYDGKYWCMWSHGPVIEDRPTQHIRYATSRDGVHWAEDKMIAGPSGNEGERYISRGFWLRDGKLIALATLDSTVSAKAARTPWGTDLRLLGFEWDKAAQNWKAPIVIFNDTMNNFPPQKLPSGEWAMIRRDHAMNVGMLIGGVSSPSDWKLRSIATGKAEAGKFRPEEPEWWTLPDGRQLGLFRDNAKSKRLFRAISNDGGNTWTTPEKTNFPDATSKFFGLRTSRGYYVLVSNPNPARRNPLCLSVSEDGIVFNRMARLPMLRVEQGADAADDTTGKGDWVQYPHVIEQDDCLLISYSRKKTSIEVVKVSLDEIDKLRRAPKKK